MPEKQHLPSVSDKEQRMYEHIKRSEREQGRSIGALQVDRGGNRQ